MTICAETGIAYDRAGPSGATPLLLLHAGVADRGMWEPQWSALTAEHDVVRLDLRGFGDSVERPADELDPVADVASTLATLGVDRTHVVACSFGAGVAAELAVVHPGLVASLLLVTPGGSLIPEVSDELRSFAHAEESALEAEDLDAAVRANVDWWVDGPHRDSDEARAAVRQLVSDMQRRAFAVTAGWDDVEQAELEPPVLERLDEIAVPTLVLSGEKDMDVIGLAARAVLERVSGARQETWSDVAHLPSLERPEEFTALVREWLASQPG